MGIIDSAQSFLNRGMAATERGTRLVSLKAQLGGIDRDQERAFAALGESLYEALKGDPSARAAREDLFGAVERLASQRDEVKRQIAEVEAQAQAAREETARPAAAGPRFCIACGAQVEEGQRFCQACGAPLNLGEQPSSGVDEAAAAQPTPSQPGRPVQPTSASDPTPRPVQPGEPVRSAVAQPTPAPDAASASYEVVPESYRRPVWEITPESVTTVGDK